MLKIPKSPPQHLVHFSKGSALECHRAEAKPPSPLGMEQNLDLPHSVPSRTIWLGSTISAAPFTNTRCAASQHVKQAQRCPYSLLIPKSQRAKLIPLGKRWIFSFLRECLPGENAILICYPSLFHWLSPDFPGKEYKASNSVLLTASGKEQLRKKPFFIFMVKR